MLYNDTTNYISLTPSHKCHRGWDAVTETIDDGIQIWRMQKKAQVMRIEQWELTCWTCHSIALVNLLRRSRNRADQICLGQESGKIYLISTNHVGIAERKISNHLNAKFMSLNTTRDFPEITIGGWIRRRQDKRSAQMNA